MRIFTVRSEGDEAIYSSMASICRGRDDEPKEECLGDCGVGCGGSHGGYRAPEVAPARNEEGRFVGPPVRPLGYEEEVDLGVANFPPPPPVHGAALPIHYVAGARPKIRIGLPPLPELRGDTSSDSD